MRLIFSFLIAAGLVLAGGEYRIQTIAGNGDSRGPVAGAVAEGSPVGEGWTIAFDRLDRLYLTTLLGEVWRTDLEGKWERLWRADGGVLLFGMTVDSGDRVFVSDLLGHRVYRIDPDGTSVVVAGSGRKGSDGDGGRAVEASLDAPMGLALDGAGNLFIAEEGRVRVVDAEGRIRTHATGTASGALSMDRDGVLYAAHFSKAALQKIGADGSVSDFAAGSPLSVAACADGGLYFSELYRVQRVGTGVIAGSLERGFAGEEGAAQAARFLTPLALACDSQGRVAVYDATAARVRRIAVAP